MQASEFIGIYEIIKMLQTESVDNANMQNNAETLHKEVADVVMKRFALSQLPEDVRQAHTSGDLHIHDLEYFVSRPFCQDHDLRYFFYYGLMPDGSGKKASVAGPAKRPEVAVLHAVKALGSAQTNFAGGQGFYNFLTFLAPYLEGLSYTEIKQLMQMFVYEMTQMMVARGGQLVFSSVQLTPGVPKLWKDKPAVYKGKVWNGEQAPLRLYGEFEREVRFAFQALMEVLLEGDHRGRPFSFPKAEVGLMREFLVDEDTPKDCKSYHDLYILACKVAAKNGSIYWDNMLPAYRAPPHQDVISCVQCCSYSFSAGAKSDSKFYDKLYFKDGAHFSMGGWQVVTLNLPRMAMRALQKVQEKHPDISVDGKAIRESDALQECAIEAFRAEAQRLLNIVIKIFNEKKKWMELMLQAGKMPFITQRPEKDAPPLVDLDQLVYIVGVVGLNEAVNLLSGEGLISKDGKWLGEALISDLAIQTLVLGENTGMRIMLARTPAETVASRFAALDLKSKDFREYAQKVVRGDAQRAMQMISTDPDIDFHLLPIYYTNGTHVPVDEDITMFKKISIESDFFILLPAGNICHIFLGEENPSPEGLWNFVQKIAQNTEIGYFAFTRDLTICNSCHHVAAGIAEQCERCGSKDIDYLSRITGYVQPVSSWNAAKKQEFKDRKRYNYWSLLPE